MLHAIDGHPLAAMHFEPRGTSLGTLILHGATATPQRFYRAFAQFLSEHGVRVVTYDYRGVGRSRPASLRGYRATMTEWADLDARAVHRYVAAYHGAGPVAFLGHSFGGQLVGLIDEVRDACGAVFVGAQLGYYGNWPLPQRARLAVTWRALVPTLTATLGYLPGRLGIGEDLPRGVAEEWARWCSHPEYLISEHPDAAERFARFDCPGVFYSFTDDSFAPPRAVSALLGRLSSAPNRAPARRPPRHRGFVHRSLRIFPSHVQGQPLGRHARRPDRRLRGSEATHGVDLQGLVGHPRRGRLVRPLEPRGVRRGYAYPRLLPWP